MRRILITSTELMMLQFLLPHVDNLIENGFQVEIACSNVGNRIDEVLNYFQNRVRVHQVELCRNPLRLKNSRGFFQLKKIIEKGQYNLIWTNEPVMGMMTRLAAANYRRYGLKVIYMVHGFHFYKGAPLKNLLLYYTLERVAAGFTDTIITMNSEDYKAAKGFCCCKVEFIPGIGLDIEKFKSKDMEERQRIRNKLGVTDKQIFLISVGELNKRKNHKTVIKGLSLYPNKNIKYFICGRGPLREELEKYIKKTRLQEQVYLLGYQKSIEKFYLAADIIVFPSKQEGVPRALMEAMAAGLPVICSDIRGNRDLIVDAKGGYLVKTNDCNEYIVRLRQMLKNPKEMKEMGNFNKIKILDYSFEKVKAALTDILKE